MNNPKKVVLLVDDSLLILERMIPILDETSNIEFVVHAGTYNEAVTLLEELVPHLVLLDINLPDRSGIDLLRLIGEKYKDIIVFIVTNQATAQYRETCRKLGARHFFDKSRDFEAVSEAISEEALSC